MPLPSVLDGLRYLHPDESKKLMTVFRHDSQQWTPDEVEKMLRTAPAAAHRLLAVPRSAPGWMWAFGWRPTHVDASGHVARRTLRVKIGCLIDGEQFEVDASHDGEKWRVQIRRGRGGWRSTSVTSAIAAVAEVTPDLD